MDWNDYFMGFARHAAGKSKDTTKVGAVLVGPDREVRLTAYNGPPAGVDDKPERFERPAKYLFASHAEANLIAFAARVGIPVAGCSVYVTHHPCASCARTLIQAGIREVVFGGGSTSMPQEEFSAAREMFREADVPIRLSPGDDNGPRFTSAPTTPTAEHATPSPGSATRDAPKPTTFSGYPVLAPQAPGPGEVYYPAKLVTAIATKAIADVTEPFMKRIDELEARMNEALVSSFSAVTKEEIDRTKKMLDELVAIVEPLSTEKSERAKPRMSADEFVRLSQQCDELGFDIARHPAFNCPASPPPPAGPTGAFCADCGGVSMVRSGTCLTCQTCGSTSGCS